MRITCADPAAVPEHVLSGLHRAVVDTAAQDQPYEPPPTWRSWHSQLLQGWSGDPVVLLLAADGCGHAVVELPSHDNPHVAFVEVHVARDCRRRGWGRALLWAAADLVRAQGRRTVLLEARVGTPMEALLAGSGAALGLVDVRRHQQLADLDLQLVERLREGAAEKAAGYRLESWAGPTPDHLRDAVAAATLSLNDAPLGGLDYADEAWDGLRVAERDVGVAAAGLRMHSVLALAGETPAGLTDVAVSEDGTYAWQWNTGVDPAHRGHGLGMLLKTTMVTRLRALEPGLRVLSTWNAEDNPHMIVINDALGYVPVDRMGEWQLELG